MLKLATKFAPEPAAFEAAYRAGYRHAELYLDAVVLARAAEAIRLARHYPIDYVPHFPNRGDLGGEALRATVELYRALACRCLVIHRPMFERFGTELLALAPEMCLAVENHKLTPAHLTEWAERSPGLTLDVEHFWKFTHHDAPLALMLERLSGFLGRFAAKIRHVHMPGYWPGLAEHRPMYCAREMVFPVLALLAEAGFDGLVVSEVDLEYQNANDLRMDALLFDRWRELHDPVAGVS